MSNLVITIAPDQDGDPTLKIDSDGVSLDMVVLATTELLPECIRQFAGLIAKWDKALEQSLIVQANKVLIMGQDNV